MKKYICLISGMVVVFFVVMFLSVGMRISMHSDDSDVFLADVFVVDRDKVERLSVVWGSDGDPVGYLINKDEFFDMAEKIPLSYNPVIKKIDEEHGIMIIAEDVEENAYRVWVGKNRNVGNRDLEMSSAITTRYKMSRKDYVKMFKQLPKEVKALQ